MGTGSLTGGNARSRRKGAGSRGASPAREHHAARLGFDVWLLVVIIALALFGILMVYSASADFAFQNYGSSTYILQRQAQWLGLGIVAMLVFSRINYHYWRSLALPLMIVAILALVGVLILQQTILGSNRSLSAGSIQPSELAKLALVIYLGVWLYNRRDQLHGFSFGLLPLGIILGILGVLIIGQPDYSAVATIIFLGGLMFFLAGGELRQLAVAMGVGVLVGWLILRSGIVSIDQGRWDTFVAGIKNPLDYHPHVRRSLEAFMRGSWFGVGIGKSETKLNSLPFPHTDSIFAVVGEETGVIGALTLVGCYLFFLWRGLKIARNAPDGLGSLLAGGLSFWIVIEAMLNMAVMVGLMPFAGNALPLISYGGSSLVMTLCAVGILLNISRLSAKKSEQGASSAVVNLRRRNGRQRVSRPIRSANLDPDD